MRLDPRTKLFILAFTGILAFLNRRIEIEFALFLMPALLLCLSKSCRRAAKYAAGFGILLLIPFVIVPRLPVAAGGILYIFSTYIRKFIPCFMLGNYLIRTTKVSQFMAAIHRMRVPKGFGIALSITLRYFPAMKEEWTLIREAMALRGLSASPAGVLRHPIKTMEYVYVPMLICASRISDEITQAALTRGIDHIQRRTCLEEVGFSVRDVLIAGVYGVLLFIGLRLFRY